MRTTRRPTVSATTWGRVRRGSSTATATSHLRPSTNTAPCHQGFHDGCMADMPDDDSCCPGDDAAYDSATRSYINGGTCLAKSTKAKHEANAEKLAHAHLRAHRHRQARRHRVVPVEVLDVVRRRPLRDAQVGPRVRGSRPPRRAPPIHAWLIYQETTTPECTCHVDTHHPENGGYYVAGINGLDNSAERSANGMRAADMMWAKGMDYHHGQLAACEGIFCPTPNPPVPQYIFAHTARTSASSTPPTPARRFGSCPTRPRSTRATSRTPSSRAPPTPGRRTYEYKIEGDHVIGDVLYFASKEGCTEGQKAAVQIGEDYTATYGQCYDMGASFGADPALRLRLPPPAVDEHCPVPRGLPRRVHGRHAGRRLVLPGRRRRVRLGDPLVHQRRHLPRQEHQGQARGERREAEGPHTAHRHAKLDATESCPSSFSMSYDGGLCAMHKSVRECEGVAPRVVRHRPRMVHLPGDDDAGVHVPRRHAPPGEWWLLCRGHQRPRQLRRAQRERKCAPPT